MNRRMFRPRLVRVLHRWLGLAFSLTAFSSAGSGVLHTVMSRTQAPPPPARPLGTGLDITRAVVPLGEAVGRLPGQAAVEAVNLREIDGEPWYQVYVRGRREPHYVSAATGTPDDAKDEAYASQIASSFLGGRDSKKTDYLTGFNAEYVNIFRILPVYRFDADDGRGTRLYVSTTTGSVTRHTDDARQFEASIFSTFHKWMFLKDKGLRDAAIVAARTRASATRRSWPRWAGSWPPPRSALYCSS